MSHPRCFDSQRQYDAWKEVARRLPPPAADGICADCLPSRKRQMLQECRCDHPEIVFVFTRQPDGSVTVDGRNPFGGKNRGRSGRPRKHWPELEPEIAKLEEALRA